MKHPNVFLLLSFFSFFLFQLSLSQTCTITNCLTCDATGTTCSACSTGYMLDATANCLQCTSSCASCSTSTTYCDTCTDTSLIPASGICASATTCNNALNLYFDGKTSSCLPCTNIVPSCSICSQYLPTATICLSCLTGNYLDRSLVLCLPCGNGCSYCNNGGTCGSCYPGLIFLNSLCFCTTPGTMYDSILKKCISCTPGCLKCSGMTTCSTCDTANGWSLSGTICINCNLFCLNCGPTGCITCQPAYQPVNGQCKPCALALPNPGCSECTSTTQCLTCLSTGYFMNSTTSLCQSIACNSSQTAVAGVCKSCSTLYDIHCTQCNSASCIFCTNGYVYNTTSLNCELRKVFGCGDGFWVTTVENCDDWNMVNGDGCDENCQPQTDYVCNIADKQPIGTSLCKYTKNFTVSLEYIKKDPYSNTAHLFFTIEPAGFLEWTSEEIQNLLSPVQITDLSTGLVVSISYKQISFNFQRIDGANRFQIVIDSYQQSVQNSYFKVNLNLDKTSIPSIKNNAIPDASIIQLSSKNNGVPLYIYSEEIYSLQVTLEYLCIFIGYLSMAFLFVGFVVPSGKLIVVESLAVIQLTFFSVLQFKNIPPTYIGFKELTLSNGYNIQSLIKSPTINLEQSTYGLLGLSDNVFGNFNISFVLLFVVPALLSAIGYCISRYIMKNKLADNAEMKEILMEIQKGQAVAANTEEEMLYKLRTNIFKRILLEVSFYGLISTGYLAWVSVLNSFTSFDSFSISNLIFSIIILTIWVAYGVVYIRTKTSKFNLNGQNASKQEQDQSQSLSILRFFGEFRQIYEQISKKTSSQGHPIQKVYIIFMVQRILVSALIVMVAPLFSYFSILIIVFYITFFLLLIFCHRRLQSIKQEERVPLFSHIYQNYTLRQCINFITTMIIQIIFLIQQANFSSQSVENAMTINSYTTKIAPVSVLSLLLVNLIFNILVWIWQLKSSQTLAKGKIMIRILMYKKPQQMKKQERQRGKEGEAYFFQAQENEHLKPRRRRQEEIDEIIKSHNSNTGSGKSLFMGVKEKARGSESTKRQVADISSNNLQMIQQKQAADEI